MICIDQLIFHTKPASRFRLHDKPAEPSPESQ